MCAGLGSQSLIEPRPCVYIMTTDAQLTSVNGVINEAGIPKLRQMDVAQVFIFLFVRGVQSVPSEQLNDDEEFEAISLSMSLRGLCVNGGSPKSESRSSGDATKVGYRMTRVLSNELEAYYQKTIYCCWCYLTSLTPAQLEKHRATFEELGSGKIMMRRGSNRKQVVQQYQTMAMVVEVQHDILYRLFNLIVMLRIIVYVLKLVSGRIPQTVRQFRVIEVVTPRSIGGRMKVLL